MSRLIIMSNRVSAPKARSGEAAQGGLAMAMGSALRESGGIWFGWSGQVTDTFTGRMKTSRNAGVTTSTVDLEPQDVDEYYNGYANRTLWPLFHYRVDLAEFDRGFGAGYERVNQRLASTALSLIEPDDLIWVHDYHLIPLGDQLRQMGVTNRIGFFLHTPWPPHRLMTALPYHRRLVESMLAYDLIGFQTEDWLASFHHYVECEMDGSVDAEGIVTVGERVVRTGAFPIGIDVGEFDDLLARPDAIEAQRTIQGSADDKKVIIGVDRLDYTKGLVQRFEGYGHFLEEHPEWQHRTFLLQIAPPSRGEVHTYEAIRDELDGVSGRINGRFAHVDWVPIRYVNQSYPRAGLAGLYRGSDVALITPLLDGMNLVAKEYVAAQDPDNPGVLILSKFAGAALQMTEALLVNPYSKDAISDALATALAMPLDERKRRWRALMTGVRNDNVHEWRADFLAALERPDGDGDDRSILVTHPLIGDPPPG